MLQNTNPRTLRLLEFAEFIEALPNERIDTTTWFNPLKGTCCYAGHVILKYATAEQQISAHAGAISYMALAKEILGLDSTQARIFIAPLDKAGVARLLRQWAYEIS